MIFFWLSFAIIAVITAYKKNSLTTGGMFTAFFVGITIGLTTGEVGIIALILFFVSSSLLSRFKKKRKKQIEKQFEKTERRDSMQVLANGMVGVVFSVLFYMTNNPIFLWCVIVSFATANADTWATELGILNTKNPVCLRTWKRVKKGSSGAISLFGSTCSLLGAAFVVLPCVALISPEKYIFISAFLTSVGFLGGLWDSILGAFLQGVYRDETGLESEKQTSEKIRGFYLVNNDFVNFTSILISACTVLYFGKII